MGVFIDLKGTTNSKFQIEKGGPQFKNNSGEIQARNAGDSAFADLYGSMLKAAADSIEINADAAGAGNDWKVTLARNAGMTGALTFTLPIDAGIAGQALITDGAGNLSWDTITDSYQIDTTSLVFGDGSPKAMFTLPANAVVHEVEVIIDTPWDDSGTVEVGIAATPGKYMGTADNDLEGAAGDSYIAKKNNAAVGGSEAIIATYVPGGAETAGAARILVKYSIPS